MIPNPANEPLPGTVDEWEEFEPNRFHHVVDGEVVEADGIVTLTPPLTFEEYYDQRANQASVADAGTLLYEQPPPTRAELDALMDRIKALEAAAT